MEGTALGLERKTLLWRWERRERIDVWVGSRR